MKHVGEWPVGRPLWSWQRRAFQVYLGSNLSEFLAVATPGAGKTTFALYVAHHRLKEQSVDRVIVVVHTEHLKEQWKAAAKKVGIELEDRWKSKAMVIPADFHGIVVTYQQVASSPQAFRHLCHVPTLVIFDEIHHAADGLSWGNSLRQAFELSIYRLSLSGTPFRSDNNTIPFVPYANGKCVPHYSYAYGAALADRVCREVIFPSYEGRMTWISGDEERTASFDDPVTLEMRAERLKAALDPDGEWMTKILEDANAKLTEVRRDGHPDAGGLVIAMSAGHARAIARKLRARCGESVVVVTYEDPAASTLIKAFEKGKDRWIVAVRMISEGVDIPRLRVGVYATNVLTELFFRQAVGRIVRKIGAGGEDESGWFFVPNEEILVGFLRAIREEREHQLEDQIDCMMGRPRRPRIDENLQPRLFAALDSEGWPGPTFYDAGEYTAAELEQAGAYAQEAGLSDCLPLAKLAALIRMARAAGPAQSAPAAAPPPPAERPLADRKRDKRRVISRQVNLLHEATGAPFSHIHQRLNTITGSAIDQATEAQLDQRIALLAEWRIAGEFPDE